MKSAHFSNKIPLALGIMACVSCSTGSKVADGGLIVKRKYRSGYHFAGVGRWTDQKHAPILRKELSSFSVEPEPLWNNNDSGQNRYSELILAGHGSDLHLKDTARQNLRSCISPNMSDAYGDVEPIYTPAPTEPDSNEVIRTYNPTYLGIISVVIGLSNIFFLFMPLVGVFLGISGLVTGIRSVASKREAAVAIGAIGITVSLITLLFAVLWTVFIISSIVAESSVW